MARKLILTVFILGNFFAFFSYSLNGYLKGDISNYNATSTSLLMISLLLVFSSFFLTMAIYCFSFKVSERIPKISLYSFDKNVKPISYVFLIITLAWLSDIIISGKVAGQFAGESSSYFRYISIIFKPEYLILIYYSVYRETRLAKVVIVLYIIGVAIQGWTNYLVYLFVIEIYYRFESEPSWKAKVSLIVVFLFGVLFLPIIRMVKLYYVRELELSGLIEFIQFGWEGAVSDNYLYFADRVVQRIEHLSNYYYFLINLDFYQMAYKNGAFCSFYCEGSVVEVARKLMLGYDDINVHRFFASSIEPKANIEYRWNVTVGLLVWPFMLDQALELVLFVLYLIFLIGLVSYLTVTIKHKALSEVSWLVMLLVVAHGWFGDAVIYIQALIVFCIINKLSGVRFSTRNDIK